MRKNKITIQYIHMARKFTTISNPLKPDEKANIERSISHLPQNLRSQTAKTLREKISFAIKKSMNTPEHDLIVKEMEKMDYIYISKQR